MISSQIIKTILNNHVTDDDYMFEVVIYDTFVLAINICNESNYFIHIPSDTIRSFEDRDYRKMSGYISSTVRFFNNARPLTKKWMTEHRISEIVLKNIESSKCIYIYDNCIIIDRLFIVTNSKIYVFANDDYYECSLTLYNTNVLCDIHTANIIGPRYEMPLDKFHTVVSQEENLYKKIVEHRSRGFIKQSSQLCDIVIFFDKN
jgi:hypothetical protein